MLHKTLGESGGGLEGLPNLSGLTLYPLEA